jgi:hypothetical protein
LANGTIVPKSHTRPTINVQDLILTIVLITHRASTRLRNRLRPSRAALVARARSASGQRRVKRYRVARRGLRARRQLARDSTSQRLKNLIARSSRISRNLARRRGSERCQPCPRIHREPPELAVKSTAGQAPCTHNRRLQGEFDRRESRSSLSPHLPLVRDACASRPFLAFSPLGSTASIDWR